MTLDQILIKWQSKKRRMGCVNATNWLCKQLKDFYPLRLSRYTKQGNYYEHVVATNGSIIIDLAPYNDCPKKFDSTLDGNIKPLT